MVKSKMSILLFFLVGILMNPLQLSGQNLQEEIVEPIMIKLFEKQDLERLKLEINKLPYADQVESLTRDGLVHQLFINAEDREQFDFYVNHIANLPYIKYIEKFIPLSSRSGRPNDFDYFEQFQMMNMEMEDVWCRGNNATTVLGDTIVIAVVEEDKNLLFHPEINDNLWINHGEIPMDSMDNDGNGYVDDYYGIEANSETGTGLGEGNDSHGLGVMGIIGAKGNNNELLAGMAWNVKMLNVTRSNSNINAVRAYDYIYEMRKQYNDTNGDEGAYIVASNSSFGADDKFPSDTPIWCEAYDKMASVGILSIGAVRNQDLNIDVEGDIPGLCPSNGLITVANITFDDEAGRSGYSTTNVDLAAYGTFVPSLNDSDSVFFWTGTSFSAPHVTGLIGLFYGQACERFIRLSKDDPGTAVETMKSFILEKALPIPSQVERSLTEGKLDPPSSQNLMFDYCGVLDASLSIDRIYYNSNSDLVVEFIIPEPGNTKFNVYNAVGQKVYSEDRNVRLSEPWIHIIEMDVTPMGLYYLQIEKENEKKSKAFIWNRG